jgi:predicted dithiol-disulfide oxidoreductase (DUF899 family)
MWDGQPQKKVVPYDAEKHTMSTSTAPSAALHKVRFPNESDKYRAARDGLLKEEIELRRQVERVAALRRSLPLGGVVPEDYLFEEGGPSLDDTKTVNPIVMSALFGDKPTLIAYSFMFGPKMANPCPMCTSLLDALNGNANYIRHRATLVVIAKSPIGRIRDFARERGWSKLRLLSSAGNSYNEDYAGETAGGAQMPALNVFVRRDGEVHHFYNTEMLLGPKDAGQDQRHVDMIWPLWNALDFTPEGRGATWYPHLNM